MSFFAGIVSLVVALSVDTFGADGTWSGALEVGVVVRRARFADAAAAARMAGAMGRATFVAAGFDVAPAARECGSLAAAGAGEVTTAWDRLVGRGRAAAAPVCFFFFVRSLAFFAAAATVGFNLRRSAALAWHVMESTRE